MFPLAFFVAEVLGYAAREGVPALLSFVMRKNRPILDAPEKIEDTKECEITSEDKTG